MNPAAPRRFPYAPGPLGWLGGACVIAATACSLGSGGLLIVAVLKVDGRLGIIAGAAFLVGCVLLGAAFMIWRVAWKRTGTLPPPSRPIPRERRAELFIALAVMNFASLVGLAGFVYIALHLSGNRRFVMALVPLTLASIGSQYGAVKMREIRGRPSPGILGWKPRHELAVVSVAALAISAFLLIAGLFWIPN